MSRYNILCIEDNLENMILFRRVLQARGYKLFEARNGTQGISIAENQDVDLILLDVNLPDIDGYEVANRLRSNAKQSLTHIPIIIVTANAMRGDAESAITAGADRYMSKPIDFNELWDCLETFLP